MAATAVKTAPKQAFFRENFPRARNRPGIFLGSGSLIAAANFFYRPAA
jgi:hypothetical protein